MGCTQHLWQVNVSTYSNDAFAVKERKRDRDKETQRETELIFRNVKSLSFHHGNWIANFEIWYVLNWMVPTHWAISSMFNFQWAPYDVRLHIQLEESTIPGAFHVLRSLSGLGHWKCQTEILSVSSLLSTDHQDCCECDVNEIVITISIIIIIMIIERFHSIKIDMFTWEWIGTNA